MRIIAIFGAILLAASLAHAGAVDDCNQVRDLNRQLRGCTAYLKLGTGAPQNLATAHLNRANIYAQRRKYEQALKDYASAIALDPLNPLALYNRGNAYFDTQQYELAIQDFTRAVELDGGFALAYLNRGIAYEHRGDMRAAAEDYRRAVALDPSLEGARRRLKRLPSQ